MPSNLDRALVAVEEGLEKICDRYGPAITSDARGEAPKGAPHWEVKPPMQSLLASEWGSSWRWQKEQTEQLLGPRLDLWTGVDGSLGLYCTVPISLKQLYSG
jgi:hypothetical protein